MEKEIPQESDDLYSISQQNIHKFFNEFNKSISQYQQFMASLQLECIKSCGTILDSSLSFNQKFVNKPTVIPPTIPLKMTPPVQQTKIEEKAIAANEHTVQNQTISKLPPSQASSIISSEEIQPPKPALKKIKKFGAERFWKNAFAHQRGNLLRMVKIQDEQIKILVNKHYQDLPTSLKHEIETSGIKKEDLK